MVDLAVLTQTLAFDSMNHIFTRIVELIVTIFFLLFAAIATDEEYEPKQAIKFLFLYAFLSGVGFAGLKIVDHESMSEVSFLLVSILFLGKILIATISFIINDIFAP